MAATDDFLLILCRRNGDVLRVLPKAFTLTQKRQREMEAAFVGCNVVSAKGEYKEILGLQVGQLANSILSHWFAWLSVTGARTLQVFFSEERAMSVDDLRVPLIRFLRANARVDEWAGSKTAFDELIANVEVAATVEEIFFCIAKANPSEGGLDVLG